MFTVQSLHVSFEMWGSVFCFIIALSMFLGRNIETKRRKILMEMHFLALLIPFIGGLLDFSLLLQYRKKVSAPTFGCLVSYMILPMVALVILIFFYGIALVNISICISVIFMFVVSTVEQNREMAEETVKEFTTYLRGNIDSLTNPKNITFAKELEHVKSYLAIEQKRFGARVQVVYDIRETDFEIPALSLQVLVENAVKHGICKKPEGGTVTIRTERRGQNILLTVQDTGVGFDPTKKKTDDKIHAGIENVQTCLKNMCSGKMEICSTPGREQS